MHRVSKMVSKMSDLSSQNWQQSVIVDVVCLSSKTNILTHTHTHTHTHIQFIMIYICMYFIINVLFLGFNPQFMG